MELHSLQQRGAHLPEAQSQAPLQARMGQDGTWRPNSGNGTSSIPTGEAARGTGSSAAATRSSPATNANSCPVGTERKAAAPASRWDCPTGNPGTPSGGGGSKKRARALEPRAPPREDEVLANPKLFLAEHRAFSSSQKLPFVTTEVPGLGGSTHFVSRIAVPLGEGSRTVVGPSQPSKKAAERAAAVEALQLLGVIKAQSTHQDQGVFLSLDGAVARISDPTMCTAASSSRGYDSGGTRGGHGMGLGPGTSVLASPSPLPYPSSSRSPYSSSLSAPPGPCPQDIWGENPKNELIASKLYARLVPPSGKPALPLSVEPARGGFCATMPVPFRSGQPQGLAVGRGINKSAAERACVLDALEQLRAAGLIQPPGQRGSASTGRAGGGGSVEVPAGLPCLEIDERHQTALEEALKGLWDSGSGAGVAKSACLLSSGAGAASDASHVPGVLHPLPSGHEAALNAELMAASLRRTADPSVAARVAARLRLPVAALKDEILDAVARHHAVLLVGETGCGKTTQVPQLLLEDAEARGVGAGVRILVTQPRRVAAVTVAERVAWERGEALGEAVGYCIKLDNKRPRRQGGTITFVTTGILLRQLQSGEGLNGISHVIIDEAHERSLEIDFLLALMKEVAWGAARQSHAPLPSATMPSSTASMPPSSTPAPKIIVMSATLESGIFEDYLRLPGSRHPCPKVTIPGSMHPVTELYLDALAGAMGARCPAAVTEALSLRAMPAPTRAGGPDASISANNFSSHDGGSSSLGSYKGAGGYSGSSRGSSRGVSGDGGVIARGLGSHMASSLVDGGRVNVDVVAEVALFVCYVLAGTSPGAVLVFLPTLDVILAVAASVAEREASWRRGGNGGFSVGGMPAAGSSPLTPQVMVLHSSVSNLDQRRVFDPPPPGHRKLILSTNIAETSVTIDDVVFVVDAGRAKEKVYHAHSDTAHMVVGWTSKASCKQRAGRAGRVGPGICIRLFPRHLHGVMDEHTMAELLRSPLEELVLHVKALGETSKRRRAASLMSPSPADVPLSARAGLDLCAGAASIGGAQAFLSRLIQPPPPASVTKAIVSLQEIGAMDFQESLTPLGRVLAQLPLHPRLGKAVVFGGMLGCLDKMLAVAAASDGKDPFSAPPAMRDQADAARRQLAASSGAAASDQLALLAALDGWEAAEARGGVMAGLSFCDANYLSANTLRTMAHGRDKFRDDVAGTQLAGVIAATGGTWEWARAADARRDGMRARDGGVSHTSNAYMGGGGGSVPSYGGGSTASGGGGSMAKGSDRISSMGLLRAVLCAALYPNVAYTDFCRESKGHSAPGKPAKYRTRVGLRLLGTGVRVFPHPSSVLNERALESVGRQSHHVVFQEKVQGANLFIKNCTLVPTLALVFFGGALSLRPLMASEQAACNAGPSYDSSQWGRSSNGSNSAVASDIALVVGVNQLVLRVKARTGSLLARTRRALDGVLEAWLNGHAPMEEQKALVNCVRNMLISSNSYQGLPR